MINANPGMRAFYDQGQSWDEGFYDPGKMSCTVHYQLVGDKEYKDVKSLSLGETKFPVSVAPTQSLDFLQGLA